MSESVSDLNATYAPVLPLLIQQFLFQRGFKEPEQIQKWIYPKMKDLADPFLLFGMTQAVERLIRARQLQEKICLYADFDLDGTSGLALASDGFKKLGFENIVLCQPKRLSDGYGVHSHLVDQLHSQGVTLVMTIDVGITAFEACEHAKALGIDVIITDHHQALEKLPLCHTLVNPNQVADTSGLGYLCGAGVAFYLLRALKRGFAQADMSDLDQLDLRSLLDCFCIATITDMVPLIGDNRVLVQQGMIELAKTKRAGLRALLDALDLSGRPLSSQDVAIRFAPKLNALSRMENGILPIDLYLVDDIKKAQEMVATVLENNMARVSLQGEGEAEALMQLEKWPHTEFVYVSSEKFHRGVIGLIATKLSQKTNLPVFVGSKDESGRVTGSARLPAGMKKSLVRALESSSQVLQRFGGHDAAAGFEVHADDEMKMIDLLKSYFIASALESDVVESQESSVLSFDLKLPLHEVQDGLMKWFDLLGPYGQSFEVPIFCVRDVVLREVKTLKGGHLKLRVECAQSKKTLDALYFSPPADRVESLPDPGSLLDLCGELQWNYFLGKKTIQLLLKDYQAVK